MSATQLSSIITKLNSYRQEKTTYIASALKDISGVTATLESRVTVLEGEVPPLAEPTIRIEPPF